MIGFQKNLKSILLFSQFENCKSFVIKENTIEDILTVKITEGGKEAGIKGRMTESNFDHKPDDTVEFECTIVSSVIL